MPYHGFKHSEKTKRKISEAQKLIKNHSGRFQKGHKRSNGRKGITISAEHKEKISKAISGKNNWNWKGGRIKHDGYIKVMVRNHHINFMKYDYEHRFIIENFLKRKLKPSEIIHHIDSIKDNNKIENLMVFSSRSSHVRYHKNPLNVKLNE